MDDHLDDMGNWWWTLITDLADQTRTEEHDLVEERDLVEDEPPF